jgi:hypothetical protein
MEFFAKQTFAGITLWIRDINEAADENKNK